MRIIDLDNPHYSFHLVFLCEKSLSDGVSKAPPLVGGWEGAKVLRTCTR